MAGIRVQARLAEGVNAADAAPWPAAAKLPVWVWFAVADFIAVMAIPLAASLARQTTENLARNLCFWPLLGCITVLMIGSYGGYRGDGNTALRRHGGLAIRCFLAALAALLSLAVMLGHPHILARRWTLADLALTPVLIAFGREYVAARSGSPPGIACGPLVVCHGGVPAGVAQALRDRQIGEGVSGVLDLAQGAAGPDLADMTALLGRLRDGVADVVFVQHPALDLLAGRLREEELVSLLSYPARLWLAINLPPGLPVALGGTAGAFTLVPLVSDGLVTSRNLRKRIFDVTGAAILLVILAPVLAGIAALVRASGPKVVFRQVRIGAQGRPFVVLKFRTMTEAPGGGFAQAVRGDERVTRIGRVLRRSSLDELPQLLNVLRGDMSLVGPRPHAPETQVDGVGFEQAVRLYRLRHRVRPGMTGLAQIRGQRGETRELRMLEQRLASDLEYIRSWSLWLDLSIMVSTLPVLWGAKNAY